VRAVVFDFDGVIIDTETPEFRAWAEIFERYGCELTLEEWVVCIGTQGGFDPWATLVDRATIPLPSERELQATRRARNRELIQREEPLPGVVDWLDEAADRDIPVAIASSSAAAWIEPHLERLGLRDRFACLACWSDDIPPKPDPTSYRYACEQLRVAPAEAVAVEDSPNGIAAAKAAGLYTVAVPNRLTRALDLSGADLVVESLSAMALADLVHP